MNNVMQSYPIIQASEDGRINESVFLQLHALKNSYEKEGKAFDENKPFYLEKVGGGSTSNAEGAIRNSCEDLGITGANQEKLLHHIGVDTMRYKVQPSDENKLGGFTYAQAKAFHEKMFQNEQEFRNSLINGLPFTFGANMTNIKTQMPEKSSYDFLGQMELGAPTGTTLFGSSEMVTMLTFGGEPSNITNGSTNINSATYQGSQDFATYKVIGMNLTELMTQRSFTGGYAGDTLIQHVYGRGLDIAKMKMKTSLMRDVYSVMESAKDSAGNFLVPTYGLSDIDASITQTNLTEMFSTSAGIGDFLTKVVPALVSPTNKFLETNQASLSRIVLHTSFQAMWENSVATYGLTGTGNTTISGQTYAGINIQEVLKRIKVYFGGDICHDTNPQPEDMRILCFADPNDSAYHSFEFGAMWLVVATAPTIVANYGGIGFTDQILITRYTEPQMKMAKRALFIQG